MFGVCDSFCRIAATWVLRLSNMGVSIGSERYKTIARVIEMWIQKKPQQVYLPGF